MSIVRSPCRIPNLRMRSRNEGGILIEKAGVLNNDGAKLTMKHSRLMLMLLHPYLRDGGPFAGSAFLSRSLNQCMCNRLFIRRAIFRGGRSGLTVGSEIHL